MADTATLDTLPPRQFRAGYAEVVKYGLLGDAGFFDWLDANLKDVFAGGAAREHAIATSCRMKAAIVARDERETGERALLNLGHTFGHALEAAAGFSDRLLHGEAVAIGMVLAAEFSVRLGVLAPRQGGAGDAATSRPPACRSRSPRSPAALPDADRLIDLMAQDKKVRRGRLTFILLRDIGERLYCRAMSIRRSCAPFLSRSSTSDDACAIGSPSRRCCCSCSWRFSSPGAKPPLTASSRATMLRLAKRRQSPRPPSSPGCSITGSG